MHTEPKTLADLSRALEDRTITSEEATGRCLSRIAERNPAINAFITVLADEAAAQARGADREIAGGRRRGPLHGVPISVKDLIDLRGTPTTAASRVRQGHIARQDATVVDVDQAVRARRAETEAHGEVVERLHGLDDLLRVGVRPGHLGSGLRREGEGHVARGERHPVAPAQVGAQMEGDDAPAVRELPALGERRCEGRRMVGEVGLLLEKTEDLEGHVLLSRTKAQRMRRWTEVEKAYKDGRIIKGRVTDRIKGGLTVDVGLRAFLPGSLVDIKPVKNLESLRGQELEFKVISLDRRRNNIVLSRKAVLETVLASHSARSSLSLECSVAPGPSSCPVSAMRWPMAWTQSSTWSGTRW